MSPTVLRPLAAAQRDRFLAFAFAAADLLVEVDAIDPGDFENTGHEHRYQSGAPGADWAAGGTGVAFRIGPVRRWRHRGNRAGGTEGRPRACCTIAFGNVVMTCFGAYWC